jgi:hypothetical protein
VTLIQLAPLIASLNPIRTPTLPARYAEAAPTGLSQEGERDA